MAMQSEVVGGFADKTRYIILTLCGIVYIIASGSEVLFIKTLNYQLGVTLPIFNALCINAYWVIQLPIWLAARRKLTPGKPWDKRQMLACVCIGLMGCATVALRTAGINLTPGSLYVVVATSSIVFTTILTKIAFPSRVFTIYHWIAVVVCTLAVVIVSVAPGNDKRYNCPNDNCFGTFALGMLLGIASSFTSSLTSIVADKLFTNPDGSKQKKSVVSVMQISTFNALIPSLLLPLVLLPTGEGKLWAPSFSQVAAAGSTGLLVFIAAWLGVAKMVDRLAKFQIIAFKTAFFMALLDTTRRMLSALLAIVVLDETANWNKIVGLFLAALGMIIYGYGSRLNKARALQLKSDAARRKEQYDPEREPSGDILAGGEASGAGAVELAAAARRPAETTTTDGSVSTVNPVAGDL